MADNSYPTRTKVTTPRGVFVYPRINEADTKFKPAGEFSVRIKCPGDSPIVLQMIEQIDTEAAACLALAIEGAKEKVAKAKNPKDKAKAQAEVEQWETKYLPYAKVTNDQGEDTGEIEFKFVMTATGVSKKTNKPWSRKPRMFDGKGAVVPTTVNVWGGTEGKVSGEIIPYSATPTTGASVKLSMDAVQILKLVSGKNADAGDYGFETDEEGYDSSDYVAPAEEGTGDGSTAAPGKASDASSF